MKQSLAGFFSAGIGRSISSAHAGAWCAKNVEYRLGAITAINDEIVSCTACMLVRKPGIAGIAETSRAWYSFIAGMSIAALLASTPLRVR